jgi:dTDP-4-dehydrorhamnose 3,5-epimerase
LFEELALPGLKLVTPGKHGDDRGFFSETYNASAWEKAGLHFTFVQDNHSHSRDVGTVRGLHFQTEPFAQDKLIRVLNGRILDVVVDLRRASPTFGQHVLVELSKENWRQLFIPKGFAHGFVTLEPDSEIAYKVTNFYSPAHDFGVAWNDPDLAIDWGVADDQAILSEKDRRLPLFRELREVFP